MGNAATGLVIVVTGVHRIRSGGGEETPAEYGPLAYVMGTFALLVTAVFLWVFSIAW